VVNVSAGGVGDLSTAVAQKVATATWSCSCHVLIISTEGRDAYEMHLNDKSQDRVGQRPDALTRIGRFFTACVVGAVALWFLYKIRGVLLILLAGIAIAYALAPLVKVFSGNRPQRRGLGIVLAYLTVFVALGAAGVLGVRPAAADMSTFATTLPAVVHRLDARLAQASAGLRQILPPGMQGLPAPRTGDIIVGEVRSLAPHLVGYVAGMATLGRSFVTLAAEGALALVISVFILGDPAYFRKQLFAVIPIAVQADAETLLGEIDLVLAAFVRGQIVIAVVVGVIATLAMRLMGVKYAVILGLFTAVTQLIPQVGGALGLIASVALAALQSPALAFWVFVLYMVLYQISGNILGPLVMGNAIKLHPMIILLVTMVGIVLGGVAGLLLSVPAAAVLKVIWNFFYPRLASRWGLKPSRDGAGPELPPDLRQNSAPLSAGRD
jgi:predicted PurR-regulated permease PerM